MTPRITAYDRAVAFSAFGLKKCPHCLGVKVRDVEAFCKRCWGRLPEAMGRNLRDRDLFAVTYHAVMKWLSVNYPAKERPDVKPQGRID